MVLNRGVKHEFSRGFVVNLSELTLGQFYVNLVYIVHVLCTKTQSELTLHWHRAAEHKEVILGS